MQIPFNNRYATLSEGFFEKIRPTPVKKPELIKFNDALAGEPGISTDHVSAFIGPVLREYLVSEAMQQLNVPTTRALFRATQ